MVMVLEHHSLSASLPETPPIRFRKLFTLEADAGRAFTRLTFSPDGKVLAASRQSADQIPDVTLWDVETRRLLHVLPNAASKGHEVAAIAFVPPGDRLVTACGGRVKALLWDVRSGALIDTLDLGRSFTFGVTGVAAFPDGKRVICCMSPGLTVWDLETKTHTMLPLDEHLPRRLQDEAVARSCDSVAFTADGSRFATTVAMNQFAFEQRILFWDARTCRVTDVIPTPMMTMTQRFAYAPDGSTVAAAYTTSGWMVIGVWDARSGKKLLAGPVFDTAIIDIAYTQDAKYLLVAGSHLSRFDPRYHSAIIAVWDVRTGKIVNQLPMERLMSARMAISPDNKLLAVPGHNMDIYAIEYADQPGPKGE